MIICEILYNTHLKILINFFQSIMIVNYLDLQWNTITKSVNSFESGASGSFFDFVSMDCITQSKYI